MRIKRLIKSIRSQQGASDNIDLDSLAVWSFNMLPKYLWQHWKVELRSVGITWQKFLKILKLLTNDIIDWSLRENLTWDGLLEKVANTIFQYVKV